MNLQTLITKKKLSLLASSPENFIDEAIEMMVTRKRNALIVTDEDGQIVGILTDHDIMRAIHAQPGTSNNLYSEHVFNWMTTDVITAEPETSMSEALDLMGKHHIRHLVVAQDGKPIAVVSIRDILRTLHEEKMFENSILRDIAIAARASFAA